jgi:hypothetical protein
MEAITSLGNDWDALKVAKVEASGDRIGITTLRFIL